MFTMVAIYLNTLAKGVLEFNTSELMTLQKIAGYCPQEGGLAVHQARGMLSMIKDVNLLSFDCVSKNGRSSIIEEGQDEPKGAIGAQRWNLALYPNPTNSIITLESNLLLEKIPK